MVLCSQDTKFCLILVYEQNNFKILQYNFVFLAQIFLMKLFVYFFLLFGLMLSCSKKEIKNNKKEQPVEKKEINSIANFKPTPLNHEAKKMVSDWIEYQNIVEFLPNYYKTTTKKALFDSQRLAELSEQLKDSIRIKKLNTPSFRARLHVLYNESFRLADMDSIPSITNTEIILETKNIVNAFDAINSKINMLVSQEILENNLKEFDSILNKKDSVKNNFKPIPNKKRKRNFKKRKRKHIKPLLLTKPKLKPRDEQK